MKFNVLPQLIQFLREELAIPHHDIELALRQSESSSNQLPIVLWQYGLVSLDELDRIFDWLRAA